MKIHAIIGAILALSLTPSIVLADNNVLTNANSDLPVIYEKDWRDNEFDIPWSKPVIIRDEFDGDRVAVLDRNFTGDMFWFDEESGIISIWSQQKIRVFYYYREHTDGKIIMTIHEAEALGIKVDERVFKLTGEDGNFVVTDELATALRNAPPGGVKIRITLEESGGDMDSDIGEDTVKAWKTVYQENLSNLPDDRSASEGVVQSEPDAKEK